jgi:transposase
MAAQDEAGGTGERDTRRKRIVEEALAPGVSVAAVARRNRLNANLVFKWTRRSCEGWLGSGREPVKDKPVVVAPPAAGQTDFRPGEAA